MAARKRLRLLPLTRFPVHGGGSRRAVEFNMNALQPSKANYATIEFTGDGKYIENHNGTMFLQTNYTITNTDNTFGTLILENPAESRPIAIMNNALLITRGELMDSYTKIK